MVRREVMEVAVQAGLSRDRAIDFAVAVNEIATNALVHGSQPATIRLRRGDEELVCVVTDAGSGIDDPEVGQSAPDPHQAGGRGIWLARELCDHVEIRGDRGCTVTLRAAAPS
jgi:anti-sigma regulatory factor (Ser/Thr protein kinase)